MTVARLLFPAVRWDPDAGDWDARDRLDGYAALGVGGYILFGGPAAAVAELTASLRARSPHPILVGADLERGAGQQFDGASRLPPAAALGWLDDPAVTERAGALTGREAMALGVDWVYAPVADLDVEPANPIVGTRAFGSDPAAAARHVRAWVEGCRAAGAMTCAKHFPGHGRTTSDSHLGLPTVELDGDRLEAELAPFRAAVAAGVESVMTAHVAFPALDDTGAPATRSRPILQGLLRERLGFRGLVVTDALIMEGARAGASPEEAAVGAVAAGCDALLYPDDPEAMAAALERARGGAVGEARVAEALERVAAAAGAAGHAGGADSGRGAGPPAGADSTDGAAPADAAISVGRAEDRAWALGAAERAVHVVRGDIEAAPAFELVTVDDDLGGPYPAPSRSVLPSTLRKAGLEVLEADAPTGGRPVVVAVYADIRGFKGRPGLSGAAVSAVRAAVAAAPSSLVALFGHPRLTAEVPAEHVVCAWGGEALMQEAAAVWLIRRAGR